MLQKEWLKSLPELPGVYVMKNKDGDIIYVGKSKNLKQRLSSYVSKYYTSPKIQNLTREVEEIEYIVTNTETEALILEAQLIKAHLPKYNTLLRDDKYYPYIEVAIDLDFPYILKTRKKLRKNSLYFGPYIKSIHADQLLRIVQILFKIRSCKNMPKKVCLKYHLGICSGPCESKISKEEYRKNVENAVKVLSLEFDEVLEGFRKEMENYVKNLEFEKAIVVREKIKILEEIKNTYNADLNFADSIQVDGEGDIDVFGYIKDPVGGKYNYTVIKIRKGKPLSKDNYWLEENEVERHPLFEGIYYYYLQNKEEHEKVLQKYWGLSRFLELPSAPNMILIPTTLDPQEIKMLEEVLKNIFGKEILVKVAETEEGKRLIKWAEYNSSIVLQETKEDSEVYISSINELKEKLGIPLEEIHRIDGFDVATLSGKFSVASSVTFIDGKPFKPLYRRYRIKWTQGVDDYAMIKEVVLRRYSKEEVPDIILIDGGKGQLNSAIEALKILNLYKDNKEKPFVLALAKKLEEIYIPDENKGIILDRRCEGLKLLQRVRNEAHRFANSYLKKLVKKSLSKSILDEVEGIGPKRKEKLLKHFGSVEKILESNPQEIASILKISLEKAQQILETLRKFQ